MRPPANPHAAADAMGRPGGAHGRVALATTSSRAVAAVLPSIRAARRIVAPSGAGRGELGVDVDRRAGRDERAHLHVRHPRRRGLSCRRASASPRPRRPSRDRSARRAAASPGKTGRRGKWSPKNGADCGHEQRRAGARRRGRRPCARRAARRRRGSGRPARRRRGSARSAPRARRANRTPRPAASDRGNRRARSRPSRRRWRARHRRPRARRSSRCRRRDRACCRARPRDRKRVSLASAATGRPRKPTCAIATHAASCPTASATRQGGNAAMPAGTA